MLIPPVPRMISVKIFSVLSHRAEPLRRYSVSATLAASNACSANVSPRRPGYRRRPPLVRPAKRPEAATAICATASVFIISCS